MELKAQKGFLPSFTTGPAARRLLVLAAPESLTDALAQDLLRVVLEQPRPERFVSALHLCDFVVERNSEWNLLPRVREALVEQLLADHDLSRRSHERLLRLSEPEAAEGERLDELPRYLESTVGRAYHETFLFSEGVRGYVAVADQPLNGQQWLAGQLASEQVRLGVIPTGAVEVQYLRGMILYREDRRREAEQILRSLAQRSESRHEVAVASHLVGRIDGRRPSRRKRGEELLRKSLTILNEIEDTFGAAQVLHTLGQLIGRDRRRHKEAEEMLRESLKIGRDLDHRSHEGQVLHTLGQLIGRDRRRHKEAEEMLRESLEIERGSRNAFGIAQVLHTLGQLIGRDRRRHKEAEEMLRESLEIQMELGGIFGVAQVLHTLGQLIGRDRRRHKEAEEMLRESLEMGRNLRRPTHEAQVLYSLSQLPGMSTEAAEALLRESLDINRQMRDARGEWIVQQALQRLRMK